MSQNEYVRLSLELHLFFDRIMKEHSLFLQASFMEKNDELKMIASNFQKSFSNVLEKVTNLADGMINKEFVEANEFVTKDTLNAENKTEELFGIDINTEITMKQRNLRGGEIILSEQLLTNISYINRKTLPLIENLIKFKNDVLNQVLSCKIYTTNYPLLITHIMNEAKVYYNMLMKVENREEFTIDYLYEQELFWNNIMKEHAQFIRGLLDPSENDLVLKADDFSYDYEMILKKYANNPNELTNVSLDETIKFRDFKVVGEEGILSCKIKSIIIPLLTDHVVREANHYIRLLKSVNKTQTF